MEDRIFMGNLSVLKRQYHNNFCRKHDFLEDTEHKFKFSFEAGLNQNSSVWDLLCLRLMCMFHTVYSLCYIDNSVFVFLYILACVDTSPLILAPYY